MSESRGNGYRTFGLRVGRFLENISYDQPSIWILFELFIEQKLGALLSKSVHMPLLAVSSPPSESVVLVFADVPGRISNPLNIKSRASSW